MAPIQPTGTALVTSRRSLCTTTNPKSPPPLLNQKIWFLSSNTGSEADVTKSYSFRCRYAWWEWCDIRSVISSILYLLVKMYCRQCLTQWVSAVLFEGMRKSCDVFIYVDMVKAMEGKLLRSWSKDQWLPGVLLTTLHHHIFKMVLSFNFRQIKSFCLKASMGSWIPPISWRLWIEKASLYWTNGQL